MTPLAFSTARLSSRFASKATSTTRSRPCPRVNALILAAASSVLRSTTRPAPASRAIFSCSGRLTLAATRAPPHFASWLAAWPTAPPPPATSTVCPWMPPSWKRQPRAAIPARAADRAARRERGLSTRALCARNTSPSCAFLRIRAFVTEAALEMPPAFEIALLEDPGVAAFGIGEDFPGVVVGVPEKEAVGSVAGRGLVDVVQAPLLRLRVASPPCLVHLGVGVDVQAVVVDARHALLFLGVDHGVHMVAAEADHEGHGAGAHYLQTEELLVETARRLEIFRAERAVRDEFRLEHRTSHSATPA